MTDQTGSTGSEAITVVTADSSAPAELTMNHAAKALADIREKRSKESSAESADTATAENESAQADAGPETAPGEEPEGNDPEAEKLPPIERPRSWSKDDDDEWNAIPRERQEKIAAKEQARETDINQRINKAAEASKAAEAKAAQADTARQQYEAKIKSALQALEREQLREFSDIKSWEDVKNLQRTDPFRYQEWDVHQKELALVSAEANAAEARQTHQRQTEWTDHVQKENALAAELIPELADKIKGPALMTKAAERLADLGFKPEELNDLASGKAKLSLYDHRLQQLIFSDLKLREIQSAKTAVAAKPNPPVVRPGTSKPAGSTVSERAQALDKNLTSTGSLKAAQELRAAQVAARRRAS